METVLIILVILLVAGSIIFSIYPPIPGPLLAYAGMILTHYISDDTQFGTTSFVIWTILTLAITLADQLLPIYTSKKFGGTKAGMIGGIIGTIAGIFSPIPFGVIIGPLLGAIIGDLYGGNHIRAAFKSGFASFLGFLIATILKIVFCAILGGIVIWKVGTHSYDAIFHSLQ